MIYIYYVYCFVRCCRWPLKCRHSHSSHSIQSNPILFTFSFLSDTIFILFIMKTGFQSIIIHRIKLAKHLTNTELIQLICSSVCVCMCGRTRLCAFHSSLSRPEFQMKLRHCDSAVMYVCLCSWWSKVKQNKHQKNQLAKQLDAKAPKCNPPKTKNKLTD